MSKAKASWLCIPVLSVAMTAGCTTVSTKDTQLPMSFMNHCAAAEGVSLKYGSLTIALGERPNNGYGIEVTGQQERAGAYELIYRERRPQPGRAYAQVMTEPCVQIILPKGWHSVLVRNQESGEEWTLMPDDDASLNRVQPAQ